MARALTCGMRCEPRRERPTGPVNDNGRLFQALLSVLCTAEVPGRPSNGSGGQDDKNGSAGSVGGAIWDRWADNGIPSRMMMTVILGLALTAAGGARRAARLGRYLRKKADGACAVKVRAAWWWSRHDDEARRIRGCISRRELAQAESNVGSRHGPYFEVHAGPGPACQGLKGLKGKDQGPGGPAARNSQPYRWMLRWVHVFARGPPSREFPLVAQLLKACATFDSRAIPRSICWPGPVSTFCVVYASTTAVNWSLFYVRSTIQYTSGQSSTTVQQH